MVIATKKLALAAYIKMHGGNLKEYRNGRFTFDTTSDKTLETWHLEYYSSCCHQHDTELVLLRGMMKRQKRLQS